MEESIGQSIIYNKNASTRLDELIVCLSGCQNVRTRAFHIAFHAFTRSEIRSLFVLGWPTSNRPHGVSPPFSTTTSFSRRDEGLGQVGDEKFFPALRRRETRRNSSTSSTLDLHTGVRCCTELGHMSHSHCLREPADTHTRVYIYIYIE